MAIGKKTKAKDNDRLNDAVSFTGLLFSIL